jgi:hypothetical protein
MVRDARAQGSDSWKGPLTRRAARVDLPPLSPDQVRGGRGETAALRRGVYSQSAEVTTKPPSELDFPSLYLYS